MNNLSEETKTSYAEAAKMCGVHDVTVARWARVGVEGIKLEYIRIGGLHFTSVEAIDRFNAALTGE